MYNIVASVDQYQQFVPWCKKSKVTRGRNGDMQAQLEIGFPPIVERYTSEVTVIPNHQVRALCTDGTLFNHLETLWRFTPGAAGQAKSCNVEFFVSSATGKNTPLQSTFIGLTIPLLQFLLFGGLIQ
ncbi:coenzyme Q-binding protein COQ10 B, mitochondrial [Pimephales promelas]|nr:coenzyme Q-binding protein COQ10 B, mitochondrial [Pimephales promelas]